MHSYECFTVRPKINFRSVAKDNREMASSLYHFSRCLILPDKLYFSRVRSDHIWSIVVISGVELPSSYLPNLLDFKNIYVASWVINDFSTYTQSPTKHNIISLSLLDCYFHNNCSDVLHSLVLTALTFATGTRHIIYTSMNVPHSLRIIFIISSTRRAFE